MTSVKPIVANVGTVWFSTQCSHLRVFWKSLDRELPALPSGWWFSGSGQAMEQHI